MRRLGNRGQLLAIVGLHVLALAVRYAVRGYINDDITHYVGQWYDYIVSHGGYRALGQAFSNYSPPYTYLLVLATYLRPLVPKLIAIKAISVAFDLVAAVYMYRLVRLRYAAGALPWVGYFAVLLAPTVVLNGACWGQCDVIYAACLLASVYYICAGKPRASMLTFGLAFAFKAQAVFLAPLVLILFVKRRVSWRHLLLVPLPYLVLALPSALLGRPLVELLTIYAGQAGTYRALTKNAPNIYVLIPDTYYDVGVIVGTAVAGAAALGMAACALRSRVRLNRELLVCAATLSVALMPFLLPKMHDRYFFPADLISIAAAFYARPLRRTPFLFQLASAIAYEPMLTGRQIVPLVVASAVSAFAVAGLLVAYLRALFPAAAAAEPTPPAPAD